MGIGEVLLSSPPVYPKPLNTRGFSDVPKYYEEEVAPLKNELLTVESRLRLVQAELEILTENKALFSRNFRAELQSGHDAKSEAYERLNSLKERKALLHESMNEVRSSLASWHQSSRSYFGNKGRKVHEYSILGSFGLEQTLAQKEDLESRRASISASIMSKKDEIKRIYEQEIRPEKEKIERTHHDREKLKALRLDGLTKQTIHSEIEKLELEFDNLRSRESQLNLEIKKVERSFWRRRG